MMAKVQLDPNSPVNPDSGDESQPWFRRREFMVLGALLLAALLLITLMLIRGNRNSISFEGALEGMKGPRPIAIRDEFFQAELDDVWLSIDSLNRPLNRFEYAAESYDAVILAALAAEASGTDGDSLADSIVGLTTGTEVCFSFEECRSLLDEGLEIDYQGLSGRLVMNPDGENVLTNFSVVTFGANNRIDDSLTQYVELVGSPESAGPGAVDRRRDGDGILTIGSLLPISGQLATYAPAQQAAIRLAIDEINFAGGVLGNDVAYIEGDSGDTSTDVASAELERLIDEGADVIIGPASTAVSVRILNRILEAGLVQISPANTNVVLSGFDDNGLYFRIAPSDDQQAYLLADLIVEDGVERVGIFAVDDLYGNSLADRLEAELRRRGIEVVAVDRYVPVSSSFAEQAEAMRAASPQGIVLISFEEGAQLLRDMVRARIGPRDVFVYGVDSNMGDGLGAAFDLAD